MKNILIIGGSGFIGSNIIEALVSAECDIFLVTRKKDLSHFKGNPKVRIINASLSNTKKLKNVISDYDIDIILHLASNLIPISNKSQFEKEMQNIILPTFELLQFISKRNLKIIFFSSGGTIYGKTDGEIKENSRLEPITYYGYSKLIIENYIKVLSRIGNLRYVILRPSNVYGKYQRLEGKQGFVAVALGKMLSNRAIEIWGDGTIKRDYIDVLDVAMVVDNIIKNNTQNKILNIGSGEGHSLVAVVKLLEKYLNISAKVIYKKKREVDVDKIVLDISSLQSCMEYKPKKLDEGIKDLIANIIKPNPYEE